MAGGRRALGVLALAGCISVTHQLSVLDGLRARGAGAALALQQRAAAQLDKKPDLRAQLKAAALGLALAVAPATGALADDELAAFAAEGHKVEVDSMCFMRKCILETKECGNDPNCLKGLSCLARCKGEGTCSTGCFAAYGTETLNKILYCSVEKEDCVKVPRDESRATWAVDPSDERPPVVANFDMNSLDGSWYKVMGWDQRYDCFDCQVNSFARKDGGAGAGGRVPRKWEIAEAAVPNANAADGAADDFAAPPPGSNEGIKMKMQVKFTLPRPRDPRGFRNFVEEEIIGDGPSSPRSMHSRGRMFGLTFWENYYVVAEGNPDGSFVTGKGKYDPPVPPARYRKAAKAPIAASAAQPSNSPLVLAKSSAAQQPATGGKLRRLEQRIEGSISEELAGARAFEARIEDGLANELVRIRQARRGNAAMKPALPQLPAPMPVKTTLTGTPIVEEDQGVAWKFIYYTGHTLQGNYKGAFVYSREPTLNAKYEPAVAAAAKQVGLDITNFCRIKNACFLDEDNPYGPEPEVGAGMAKAKVATRAGGKKGLFPIFEMTRNVAEELGDWFGDPTIVADWLLAQQERVVLQQPLETSPFADLIEK
mmetsp:Transcript_42905/g.134632  ORF Transcript_42905/g.134632 Transcript_42905/m.134632 type:complete len:597 (-) Transcript_42905:1037-2827(-)|eukprot:CAMPEP_0118859692 /NCGR_PEP_ID=MMETSP1163-20130328/5834_1 /TAXON_ID=124430 /ORGANISM="Phaeomonas parva, Strain CCMP2877" /LENGTH=596 /DNA_ID=CAMNT_0006793317 /DNA_START=358 /DNA_END=2148 /DNA_ORIENTATION=-